MEDALRAWVPLLLSMVSLGGALWSLLQSPAKKNADALAKTNDKVEAMDRRVSTIESEMRHLPDRDATHRLEISIAELNGRLSTLDERLKPVAAISERMQELLLRGER